MDSSKFSTVEAGFHPFLLERMMSLHEQDVEFNLSESGVHPMRLRELIGDDDRRLAELLSTELNYPHVNGDPELRKIIASLYEGARPENVLVTVGAIEANYLAAITILAGGGDLAAMVPNYLQIHGIARNFGAGLTTFSLDAAGGWALNTDELRDAVGPGTRMIAVCNPNNPTGNALSEAEMDEVVATAKEAGAWLLADEVYAGAERETDDVTRSFYGRYDKVVAVGSMSKAYGLPGLRIGWAVAPEELIDRMWARHEYVAISATMLSNKLAALALSADVRPRILERTRGFIRRGFPILEEWAAENSDLVELTPPDAAAIAFVKYRPEIASEDLVDRLREDESVLIAPGAHFGCEGFVRISFGLPEDYLKAGLEKISRFLRSIG